MNRKEIVDLLREASRGIAKHGTASPGLSDRLEAAAGQCNDSKHCKIIL
jgi:hypothetical protein